MATTNGAAGRASSVSSNASNLVDASGYKFSDKDTKPGKIKLKKQASSGKGGAKTGGKAEDPGSPGGTPVLPEMDAKTLAAFPSGKPREDELETVICKHCKRPQLKQTAAEHIRGCLRAKQEKARRKKEARDAKNQQAKVVDKDADDNDDKEEDGIVGGQKSAKKSAVKGMADGEGPKKGKKRKADGDDEKETNSKEPKKKKKKEEPKPKVPKPKGPVDVEKQCGVTLPNGAQCARSLTCKSHSMGAKRAVPGRTLPYDMLLQMYQKKNQARQQKAAIDANAPLQDEFETNGPVDSDEERDAVMAAISRSRPAPLVTHTLVPTRKKYHYVRMKEMLSNVLGSARGGGIFSTSQPNGDSIGLFQTESPTTMTAPALPEATSGDHLKKPTTTQTTTTNRPSNTPASKTTVAAGS